MKTTSKDFCFWKGLEIRCSITSHVKVIGRQLKNHFDDIYIEYLASLLASMRTKD
jgi:hypothetical protein